MRAAIDIGSNTVHLLVGEVKDGKVVVGLQVVRTTRLGEGCKDRVLLDVSMERTVNALADFQEVLLDHGVTEPPKIVATSAIREARNAGVLLERVLSKTGWQVKIISGEEEAMLSYRGATSLLADQEASVVVVDIGGGSTEFICCSNEQIYAESIPLGIVRVAQEQLDQEMIRERVAAVRGKILRERGVLPREIIAVGGTATDVSAALLGICQYAREKVHGYQLTVPALSALKEELQPLTGGERWERYPILGERSEIIIGGLDILLAILEQFDCQQFTVSDAGILDGLLLEA